MSDETKTRTDAGPALESRNGSQRTLSVRRDGAVAGLLGAAAIAFFFLVVDVVRGQPLATPSLLGSVLLLGLDPGEAEAAVRPDMVAAYTVVHVAAFLAFGWIFAWAVGQVERRPVAGILIVFAFACFEAAFVSFAAAFMPGVLGRLGTGAVLGANAIAAVCMGVYLLGWRAPHALRGIDRLSAERAGQSAPATGGSADPARSPGPGEPSGSRARS